MAVGVARVFFRTVGSRMIGDSGSGKLGCWFAWRGDSLTGGVGNLS